MIENLEPRVVIIILVWNDYLNTKQCLESLSLIEYKNLEIIIVDNHSHTDCVKKLQGEYKDLTYIFLQNSYDKKSIEIVNLKHLLNQLT